MEETKLLLREKHADKSIVGLFNSYDGYCLERVAGTAMFEKMMKSEAKDTF